MITRLDVIKQFNVAQMIPRIHPRLDSLHLHGLDLVPFPVPVNLKAGNRFSTVARLDSSTPTFPHTTIQGLKAHWCKPSGRTPRHWSLPREASFA